HLVDLDIGERLFGANELTARLVNVGPDATFALRWDITSPSGRRSSDASTRVSVSASGQHEFRVPYTLEEPCGAYTAHRGQLPSVLNGQALSATNLWFATWPVPIDLKLGALYLEPQQRQFARLNLGLAASTVKQLASIKLDVVERRSHAIIRSVQVPATADASRAQRNRIPAQLRGDITNHL